MTKRLIRFDWAVKKLLRQKANFGILEGFLSELLKFDIKIQAILESESNKEHEFDKYNRVDILAKTDKDELVLIEIQNENERDYFHRMLYGVSKLITEYIKEGEEYGTIKKVYSVNIVYFSLGQGDDYIYEYKGGFIGVHNGDTLQLSQIQKEMYGVQQVADIFPHYYLLKVNNFDNVAKDTLDEWVYFFRNSRIEDYFKAKGIKEAGEKMEYERLSDEEKRSYDRYEGAKRIALREIKDAKIDGFLEGKEEGKEEGREEGRKEEKKQIARNLKEQGLPIAIIMNATSLTEKEVNEL